MKQIIFRMPQSGYLFSRKAIPAQFVNLAVKQAFAITLKTTELVSDLRTFDTISEETAPVKLQIIHALAAQAKHCTG